MDSTLQKVYNTIINEHMLESKDSILVGFSGGADSVFLMLSLIKLREYMEFDIYAAHLNHGIRGAEADSDETFVTEFCKKHNIKLFVKSIDIPKISKDLKLSEETAGRNERYKFFAEICTQNDIKKIAVAHNKNDSVETVLLNMIRGSALKGLCGIKPVNGNIIRPIIEISRNEIEQYLNDINQNFCTDSTNMTDVYTRNKIRNVILKSMSEINNSVINTIYSNLQSLNNDENFLELYCKNLACITAKENEIIINKTIFDKQHIAIKNRILLNAFQMINGNCSNISSKHLEILLNSKFAGKVYSMPGNVNVKVSYNQIVFSKNNDEYTRFEYVLHPGESIELFNNVYLHSNYCQTMNLAEKNAVFIDADKLKSDKLIIRSRQDGDRFIPYGMKTPKKIKDFFIDSKIPVYKRNEIPILVDGDEIAALIPYRVSELYKVTDKTQNILMIKITKEK